MPVLKNKPDPHDDEATPLWLLRQLLAQDSSGAWYVTDGEANYLRLPRCLWTHCRRHVGGLARGLKKKARAAG